MTLLPAWWLFVPAVVNFAAYLLALWVLYLLTRDVLGSQLAGWIALLIGLSLRWPLWLGLSALSEGLFQGLVLTAFWMTHRWHKTGRRYWMLAAAMVWGLSTMTRYEGWVYAGMFGLLAAWKTRHRQLSLRDNMAGWMLALGFIPIWLWIQYSAFGNPGFFGVQYYANTMAKLGPVSVIEGVRYFPDLLIQTGPALASLALLGVALWLIRRNDYHPFPGWLALFWLAGFGALVLIAATGGRNTGLPERLTVTSLLLLVPAVVYLIVWLSRQGHWGLITIMGVLLAIAPEWRGLDQYPVNVLPEAISAGQALGQVWCNEFIEPGEHVLVEQRLWDYLPIQVLSGHPDAILFDRQLLTAQSWVAGLDDKTNPSLLADKDLDLANYLAQQQVRVVIAFSNRAKMNLAQTLAPVETWGDYTAYVRTVDVPAYHQARHDTPRRMKMGQ